jgi:hypothetical protein
MSEKPIFFISTHQVEQLVTEINEKVPTLDICLDTLDSKGLVFDFPDHPTLRPRYLGCSTSKEQFEDMQHTMPPKSNQESLIGLDFGQPDHRTLAAFKRSIEAAMEANKNKSNNSKAKKKEERIQKQQVMTKLLKRAERYFGLRPRRDAGKMTSTVHSPGYSLLTVPNPNIDPKLSWAEFKKAEAIWESIQHPPAINSEQAPPYPFEYMPIFICVDIEAYERDHSVITEIGVATFDTMGLDGIPPGAQGELWRTMIDARHFRISEYSTIRNSEYVRGCPESFEFGESEFLTKEEAVKALADCFKTPLKFQEDVLKSPESLALKKATAEGKRNIILVGHDIAQDINYMQQLGYNPLNLPNILEVIDTASLYRAWKHDNQPRSLSNILYDFDLAGWNLHNAGNDAVYTLWILLAIVVSSAELRGSKTLQKQREGAQWAKMSAAVQDTMNRVKEERDGWDTAEEGDDGGVPIKSENDTGGKTVKENQQGKKGTPKQDSQDEAKILQLRQQNLA